MTVPVQLGRRWKSVEQMGRIVVCLCLSTLCVSIIAITRPKLAEQIKQAQTSTQVYRLPPPNVLKKLSMGYQSALADYLWAHVLVTQGLRMQKKQAFSEAADYLNAITSLDPEFRAPYRLTDTLMMFQAGKIDMFASALRSRELMLRGLHYFPYDAELWLNYGQFLAYLAPAMIRGDPAASNPNKVNQINKTLDAWKKEGVNALVMAGELGGSEQSVAARSLSAVSLLNKSGEMDAAIRFLERLYVVNENEEAGAEIAAQLSVLRKGKEASRDFVVFRAFEQLWLREIPFVSSTTLSVLGPPVEPWKCSGPPAMHTAGACPRTWGQWADAATGVSKINVSTIP